MADAAVVVVGAVEPSGLGVWEGSGLDRVGLIGPAPGLRRPAVQHSRCATGQQACGTLPISDLLHRPMQEQHRVVANGIPVL